MTPRLVIFCFLLITLRSFNSFSQPAENINLYQLGFDHIKRNQYLKAIDTINVLKEKFQSIHKTDGKVLSVSNYHHSLTLFNSFIGEEFPSKSERDLSKLKFIKANFTEAIPYIINEAKERQVIMINENHYMPKHRLLTYNLLDKLYDLGYRYLALETLIPELPIELILDKNFSPYANEPNMANLIRKAESLGYELVAYESSDTTSYNPELPNYTHSLRELNQASNLARVLTKDPKAKILVHAGFGHIWEGPSKMGIQMAEYFKVITGVDPLTINQSAAYEEEFDKQLDESADLKSNSTPYVVLNSKGLPTVSSLDKEGDYDLILAWPTPKIELGRKDFSLSKTGTKRHVITLSSKDVGNLIQIVNFDDINGIPVDQFLVKKGNKHVGSALDAGKYKVQCVDVDGKILWTKTVHIN